MTLGLSPLVLLLIASLACAARWRLVRWPAIAVCILAWASMTPAVANFFVGRIEARAEPRPGDCESPPDAIVLLAGGFAREPRAPDDWQALNLETVQRVLALVERDDPARPLLIAGGGRFEVSEAEVIQSFLARVAPGRAVARLETASTDTWTNATRTARLLPPPRHIALATGALHLPRARQAFEAAGYRVCPWPLNRSHVPAAGWGAWLPQSSALRKTEAVLHETAGALVYAWRSRDE